MRLCARIARFATLALSALTLASAQAPDPGRVRAQNALLVERLPEFTCVQTIYRSVRKPRDNQFRSLETLELQVAYVNGEEVHLWPGRHKFESVRLVRRIEDGAISDGDFATHALNVFVRNEGAISPGSEDTVRGLPSYAYRFHIPSPASAWTLSNRGLSRSVAAEGWFWIDRESLELTRLEISARDIPRELAIASLTMRIDYSARVIQNRRVLLPESSDLSLDLANGVENRTRTDFSNCRRFASKSGILSWSFLDPRQ